MINNCSRSFKTSQSYTTACDYSLTMTSVITISGAVYSLSIRPVSVVIVCGGNGHLPSSTCCFSSSYVPQTAMGKRRNSVNLIISTNCIPLQQNFGIRNSSYDAHYTSSLFMQMFHSLDLQFFANKPFKCSLYRAITIQQ